MFVYSVKTVLRVAIAVVFPITDGFAAPRKANLAIAEKTPGTGNDVAESQYWLTNRRTTAVMKMTFILKV